MIIKIQKPIELNDSNGSDDSGSDIAGNHDDLLEEIDMEGDL